MLLEDEEVSGSGGDARKIPDDVQEFLIYFRNSVAEKNVHGVRRAYEVDFNNLSELHYSNERWPAEHLVDDFYKEHDLFLPVVAALYRELYFRHLVSRRNQENSWVDRAFSSNNYTILFAHFIGVECKSGKPPSEHLPLPIQWQWDMVDEFVYQYQETQRWKAQYCKNIAENPGYMAAMREAPHAWRCTHVLHLLGTLVESSGVKEYLQNQRQLASPSGAPTPNHSTTLTGGRSGPPAEDPRLPVGLGYFCIISLMRLYVLMGDYRAALACASQIKFGPDALYWKVPAAHVTLFYNLGFAYMMMRRYQDAIRVLSQILTFIGRSRSYLSTQSYQQEAMQRTTDKMYHLLVLCNALSPTRLDETLQSYIQENLADKVLKLQSDEGDAYLQTYRELFVRACPKFINPFISSYTDAAEVASLDVHEPTNRQIAAFLKDVGYQNRVFNVRSIAKLYNNLTLQLLGDLNIYLENDTIYVENLSSQRSHVDVLLKQLQRSQDLVASALTAAGVGQDKRKEETANTA